MTQGEFHHLLSRLKALSPDQMRQLRRELDSELARSKKPAAQAPGKAAKRAMAAPITKKPLTEAEIRQHMLDIGLLSQFPDTAADFDDPDDQPIDIKGEPLSETIIRERR
jgi:hypothetical protein